MSIEEAIDPSNVGDICHIIPQGDSGPRADPSFPRELINTYSNLLVLCKIHHKIVDDHPDIYPADKLRQIKKDHEEWVESTLSPDQKAALRVREQYVELLLQWEEKAEIARWDHWANLIAGWYPQIFITDADKFLDLEQWVSTRWWPRSLPVLEGAFVNYTKWLSLLLHVLYRRTRLQGDQYFTPKFYQSSDWNEERYERMYKVWETHLRLLESVLIEVCKAANLIASLIRVHVVPSYRLLEGKFSLRDTFTSSSELAKGVFEYDPAEIGDGLLYQRSDLYRKIMDQEL